MMGPQHATLSINDLPPAVLARIFTLTHPRRDGLALLLTCLHWLGVAEAECPQHLWGVVRLHSDDRRLAEQQAQAALLAGLRRRAACLAEVHVKPRRHFPTCQQLVPFWPVLLQAVGRSAGLRLLQFDADVDNPDQLEPICEAIGNLTSLKQLEFCVTSHTTLPLPAFHPISTLTRLERLSLDVYRSADELPPDLFPTLVSLTSLDLALCGQGSVAWQRPDGSGPMLRRLALLDCDVGHPAQSLLPVLQQMEQLNLCNDAIDEAHFRILPRLPYLTSLLMECMWVSWPDVLCCTGLRELAIPQWSETRPPAHPPPGSLLQLTQLAIPCEYASPAWLALPQLRSLELRGWRTDALPPSLGQRLQLEELCVSSGHCLQEVTRAAWPLTRLTRLAVVSDVKSGESQALEEGPYLAGLKHFELRTLSLHLPLKDKAPAWYLPASFATATSLELLDLGGDFTLRLRGAEDAALLRMLPRLRRVRLPCCNEDQAAVAAVDHIKKVLRQATGAGASPWHEVEVEMEHVSWGWSMTDD